MDTAHLPYALLAGSVLLAFTRGRHREWVSFLMMALAARVGMSTGAIGPWAMVWILLIHVLALSLRQVTSRGGALWLLVSLHAGWIILCCALAVHAFPEFKNLAIVRGFMISPDSMPYSFYLNFDKPLIGAAFVLWLTRSGARDWRGIFGWGLGLGVVSVVVLIGAAWGLGFVRWDPKWPQFAGAWLISNLLLTCVAEEAFFRGYLQGAGGERRWVLPVVALLFGLSHFMAGPAMMAFSAVAGLAYGYAFRRAGLEAAVLAHFTLNATHFLLFSYPALERAS